MQHHATKKWYKTAIITEIRHGGRAYLVTDQDGQLYVRGRRFLRIDDRDISSNQIIRAVHFGTLSPFPGADTSIPAVSSSSINPQSISASAQDSFIASNQPIIMQSIFASSQSQRDSRQRRNSDSSFHRVPECELPADEEPSLSGLDNVSRRPRVQRSSGEALPSLTSSSAARA